MRLGAKVIHRPFGSSFAKPFAYPVQWRSFLGDNHVGIFCEYILGVAIPLFTDCASADGARPSHGRSYIQRLGLRYLCGFVVIYALGALENGVGD